MREAGYYWIEVGPIKRIGYYNKEVNRWTLCGYAVTFEDKEFTFIDEKQIKREQNT